MKRRAFLQSSLASSSLMLLAPLTAAGRARAQEGRDTLYVTIQADGGWDPCVLMDPQVGEAYSTLFAAEDILQQGSLTYGPKSTAGGTPEPYRVGPGAEDFFAKYQQDLFVMRGVDTQTNSHLVGKRHVWTGNLRHGSPVLGALVASAREAHEQTTYPMAFMTSGGFDGTAGVVPSSRVGSSDAVLKLAAPYVVSPSSTSTARFFPESVAAAIRQREQARSDVLRSSLLPTAADRLSLLQDGKSAESDFVAVRDGFQTLPDIDASYGTNGVFAKAKVAIAALKSGTAVAANLSVGGFDTHNTHDVNHPNASQLLFNLVDYVVDTLRTAGLYERSVVVIGSEFARTTYNAELGDPMRGKDHWPITSLMVMGRGIPGGRVLGATAPGAEGVKGVVATKVKVDNGALVHTDDDDPAGFLLRPGHLHAALRSLEGMRDDDVALRFPLDDDLDEPAVLFESGS